MTSHAHQSNDEILAGVLADLDLTLADAPGAVTITGTDPITCSRHRIGDASAAAYAALGIELALLWQLRSGQPQDVAVDTTAALFQLRAVDFVTVNGVSATQTHLDPHLYGYCDFYRCGDGRWVYIVTTYPHLRDIVCNVLDCPPDQTRMRDAAQRWNAFELEQAIAARGGTCVAVRTRDEWLAHPQGRILAERPLIQIEKIADCPPQPLPALPDTAAGPLAGIRVIDNGHVIAGPAAARCMAEFGGQVLHLSHPRHPDLDQMILEVNIGKRAAYCDLDQPDQRAAFWDLLRDADMYVSSYPSLERKGFSAQRLAEQRPGLVYVDMHGWGTDGPWHERGSFDQLAASATGFAVNEGSADNPALPPTYLLNDYLAGALGAAGALEALRRRATVGGSWRVHIDLARISMWVDDLGLFPRGDVASLPVPDVAAGWHLTRTVSGAFGQQTYLPLCTQLSTTPGALTTGTTPLGSGALSWEPTPAASAATGSS